MSHARQRNHPYLELPNAVLGDFIVTSVRVEHGPGHDHVHVWNRGGKSGTLVVTSGDGDAIAELLLPKGVTPGDGGREE